jgi:hypothetical protein
MLIRPPQILGVVVVVVEAGGFKAGLTPGVLIVFLNE